MLFKYLDKECSSVAKIFLMAIFNFVGLRAR